MDTLGLVLALAELVLLAFLVLRTRRLLVAFRRQRQSGQDFHQALRCATGEVAGKNRLVGIVSFELSMLYYALLLWRRPESPTMSFTHYKKSDWGQLLAGLGMVAVLELALVHWLVQTYWSPIAAWVLSALALYGCLFFLADWKALVRRPTEVRQETVEIRLGLRWDVSIPYSRIEVFRAEKGEAAAGPSSLKAVVRGQPNFVLELAEPVTAFGAYGRRREVDRIYLQIDNPAAIEEDVRSQLGMPSGKF